MPSSRFRVAVCTILRLVDDVLQLVAGAVRSRAQLSAENLFLRKQLALYMERQAKPRRADDATRITLVVKGAEIRIQLDGLSSQRSIGLVRRIGPRSVTREAPARVV